MGEALSAERVERRLRQFERRLLDDAIRAGEPDAPALVRYAVELAEHAALPVACDAELLHLLRINFFVDAEALPFWVEGRILLSPLWRDLGEGLYVMEPALRRVLLQRLIAHRGARRTTEVATLLWQTSERRRGWAERAELRHAQQLTALNFLAPARAREWLDQARGADPGEELAPEWFVAMGGDLPELPQPSGEPGDPHLMYELLLELTPLPDELSPHPEPNLTMLHGEAGAALTWQLLRRLAQRPTPPRVRWFEVEPGSGGRRLLTRSLGRRDRIAVAASDLAASELAGADAIVAIDGAHEFNGAALADWLRAFGRVKLYLLAHERFDAEAFSRLLSEAFIHAERGATSTLAPEWPRFNTDTLAHWFRSVAGRLPNSLTADDVGDSLLQIDSLLKQTGGIPERVFEALCASAGVRWPEVQSLARARFEAAAPLAALDILRALARDYDATRERMSRGASRTAAMEGIVARMQPLLPDVPEDVFISWTKDTSAGVRLLAVRWLYTHPSAAHCQWLGERVRTEKPFVGYHALLALQQAARVLPLAELHALDGALLQVATQLAHLRTDADRMHAYNETQRIVNARRESAALLAVDGVLLLPGAERTLSHREAGRELAQREAAVVYCGPLRDGAVGTVADVFAVGTVADVLDGSSNEVRLVGRARVRVSNYIPVRRRGTGLARVQVEQYPDDPAPLAPEAAWPRLRSALAALARIDPSAVPPSAHNLVLADIGDLYACFAMLSIGDEAQPTYAEQDRVRKLDLAFDLLVGQIDQRLRRAYRQSEADRSGVVALIGRLISTAADQRIVSGGPANGTQVGGDFSWPPTKASSTLLARALALRPEEEALWEALAPLRVKVARGSSPLRLWPNGSVLRLRFIGGDRYRRERVLRCAKEWFEHANLTLEVLPAQSKVKADLRLAFNPAEGSWSYLGTDARSVPAAQPTMNLSWVGGRKTPEEGSRQAILKEFGHALGLIQEHQNPNVVIDWNEQEVIKDMSGPPNFWSPDTVRLNLFFKYPPFDYRPFDPHSVMLHPIPARWVKNHQSMGGATRLSVSDKALIAHLYPRKVPSNQAQRSAARKSPPPRPRGAKKYK